MVRRGRQLLHRLRADRQQRGILYVYQTGRDGGVEVAGSR